MAPSSSPADVLSRFLATSPTLIQDKISCVFDNLEELTGLVQFWAPVKTTGGRWLLTTLDQPFAIAKEINGGKKYRSWSVRYRYSIDMNNLEAEEDPTITIINGAAARAFLNRMPELLPDLRVHRITPLESTAVQCGLFRSVFLPIFDPSETCCVGVVECTTKSCSSLATMLDGLLSGFQIECLKTFDVQPPYKSVCGLEDALEEIMKALETIWGTLRLDFVQVWIAYKDEKHVAFSSSLEDGPTERMLGLKWMDDFSAYDLCNSEYFYERYVDYGCICLAIPLKVGEGLVGRTLENHKAHFMKKVSKLSDNQPLMMVRHTNGEGDPFECSCFVICLRSTETSDFNYVFEFLWREVPNHAILLESLLLSLKRGLPNFKYASGGELGDELPIVDVEDSTESKTKYFKIFERNKSSSASELVKECLIPLEAKCKTPPISLSQEGMIDAARNLYVSLATLKRKHTDLSDTNEEDRGAFQDSSTNNREMYLDENTLIIKAEYEGDLIKFTLPTSSATIVAIEKEISKGFELNPANYKLKYLDEDGDWILLKSDEDMKVCIKGRRNLTSIVRLRLLPRQPSDPSHTYQAT